MSAQKEPSVAIECIEALLRGESLDESIDARAAVAYFVGTAEHIKNRLDIIAGIKG